MATRERLAAMAASLCALCSGTMVAGLVAPDPNDRTLELRTYTCAECGHRQTYSVEADDDGRRGLAKSLEPMNAKPKNIEFQVDKLPKTKSEIERLLLTELQGSPECEEARNIAVIASDHCTATWTVSAFHPGTSDGMTCELALQHIVPRLQRVYDLVRKH